MFAVTPCSPRATTSTIVYDQLPWTEFEPKVRALCKAIWRYATPERIVVGRLQGGSFNRIVGLEIDDARLNKNAVKASARFILRVPRFDEEDITNQIALLRFLSSRTTILVPQIVAYSTTSENALGCPYVVQARIPGTNMETAAKSLTHKQ